MVQVVFAQNESCAGALATPPAAIVLMSAVALSEERFTWYSGPLYAANSARMVLCAVSHGVPPAAYMSQGPCAAALAEVAAAAEIGTAIATAIRHAASSRVRRRILGIRDTKTSVFIRGFCQ